MFQTIKNQPFSQIYKLRYLLFFMTLSILSFFYLDKQSALFFNEILNQNTVLSHIALGLSRAVQAFWNGAFLFPIVFLSLILLTSFNIKKKALDFVILFAYFLSFNNLMTFFLKHLLGRSRPFLYVQSHIFKFHFFNGQYEYASFPSGHTVNITTFFVLLIYFFPKRKWECILAGCFFVFFRIVYLKHYLSDVTLTCYLTLLWMPIAWIILEKICQRFPKFKFIRQALHR